VIDHSIFLIIFGRNSTCGMSDSKGSRHEIAKADGSCLLPTLTFLETALRRCQFLWKTTCNCQL